MKKALTAFIVVVLVAGWGLGLVAYLLQDQLGKLAGLVMLPLLVVPIIMAYLGHKISGAYGNPFRGLAWGNTSWYFLAWIAGLAVAAVCLVISIGLSINSIDPQMRDYIEMSVKQAAEGGTPVPEDSQGSLKIVGYATAFALPTFGVFIGAIFACLGTFPWLGWFFRRLMVGGRGSAILLMMALWALMGAVQGLLPNPLMEGSTIPLRMALYGLMNAALAPSMVWIFLKTRSAVIPGIWQLSIQNGLAGAMPFLTQGNLIFAPPQGVIATAIIAAAGIALWVWKDPGGDDLAVAAVAPDGTPITPAQLQQLVMDPHSGVVPGTPDV